VATVNNSGVQIDPRVRIDGFFFINFTVKIPDILTKHYKSFVLTHTHTHAHTTHTFKNDRNEEYTNMLHFLLNY
jgi:hypothetical protein